jgi:hypothetical protein
LVRASFSLSAGTRRVILACDTETPDLTWVMNEFELTTNPPIVEAMSEMVCTTVLGESTTISMLAFIITRRWIVEG